MLTEKQKQNNREKRRFSLQEKKYQAEIIAEKNQKHVAKIVILIIWKKSRTWGMNPHCIAEVHFKDHTFTRSPVLTASGCGYDKISSVIANVFNSYLKYKLYLPLRKTDKSYKDNVVIPVVPYGISIRHYKAYPASKHGETPVYKRSGARIYRHYEGGIGENSYYSIAKSIHGNFEKIVSTDTNDVFIYTDKSRGKEVKL